jgi:hypothetical protein
MTPAFISVLKMIDCGSNCPFWVFAPSALSSWDSDWAVALDDPELALEELVELELPEFALLSELVEEEAA